MRATGIDPRRDEGRFPGERDTQALDAHKAEDGEVTVVRYEVVDVHRATRVLLSGAVGVRWRSGEGMRSLLGPSAGTVERLPGLDDLVLAESGCPYR